MAWQENLFNNLLVIFILVVLAILLYARITGKTLPEIVREVREIFSPPEVYNE